MTLEIKIFFGKIAYVMNIIWEIEEYIYDSKYIVRLFGFNGWTKTQLCNTTRTGDQRLR